MMSTTTLYIEVRVKADITLYIYLRARIWYERKQKFITNVKKKNEFVPKQFLYA